MRRRAACVPCTYPRNVTSITRLSSSAVVSFTGAKTDVIALLIQMSMGPNAFSVSIAACSTWSESATSAGTTTARPPAISTSRRGCSSRSRSRASRPICAPRRANARAVARPTPADPPVISTTSAGRLMRLPSLAKRSRRDLAIAHRMMPSATTDWAAARYGAGQSDRVRRSLCGPLRF